MKKISVIIPCYNVERYIDRCLTALEKQTIGIENLEIICLDDKSTDGTLDRLKDWEKRYPEDICIVELPFNARQGNARNVGLQYASCEWIGFLDSDDWVELTYFERLLEAAKERDCEIVTCGSRRDPSQDLSLWGEESSKKETWYNIQSPEERKPFIIHPPLGYSAWAKLIRKDFLMENELFFPPYLTYEDAAWGSLVHLYVKKACVLEDKLYHYFVNLESTVLTKNSNHHLDCLTTQTQLWREYDRRGFMDVYRDELEIEHVFSAYLPALKAIILRYEIPDYNVYLLLREMMLDRIGSYRENPYVKNGVVSEYHQMLLSAIDHQLNRQQFLEMADSVKKIGL